MSLTEAIPTVQTPENPLNLEEVFSRLEKPFVSDDLTFEILQIEPGNSTANNLAEITPSHYLIKGNLHIPLSIIEDILEQAGLPKGARKELDSGFYQQLGLSLVGTGYMTMRSSLTQKFGIMSQHSSTAVVAGSAQEFSRGVVSGSKPCISKGLDGFYAEEKDCLVIPLEIYSQGLFAPRFPEPEEADVFSNPDLIRLSRLAIYPEKTRIKQINEKGVKNELAKIDLERFKSCFPGAFVKGDEVIVPVGTFDDISSLETEELPSAPFGVNGDGANSGGREALNQAIQTRSFAALGSGFGDEAMDTGQLGLVPARGGYILASSTLLKPTPSDLYGVVNMMRIETIELPATLPGGKPRIVIIIPHNQSQLIDPGSNLDTIRWELLYYPEFAAKARRLQQQYPDAEIVFGVSLDVYTNEHRLEV